MAIQLNDLVGAHYSLLAALTDKNVSLVNDAIEVISTEVDELKSECQLIPLGIAAVKGDTAKVQEKHSDGKKKLKEVGRECDKLKKEIEKYAITEECMAKCNSLLTEIESGPQLPTEEDKAQQRATAESRKAEAASAEIELQSLKSHLSQLHDMSTIALAKIKYITTEEDLTDNVKRPKKDPPSTSTRK